MSEEKSESAEVLADRSADETAAISIEELQRLLDHAAKGADELAKALRPIFELASSSLELKLR